MGKVVLVTGGARSGKSAFAEAVAARARGGVLYVATAEACDAEMADRIARHRRQRPPHWTTAERPLDLVGAVACAPEGTSVVLVDCLSVWAANRLLAAGSGIGEKVDDGPGDDGDANLAAWTERADKVERAVAQEIAQLLATARSAAWSLLLVSNEVGSGVVPPSPLGRAYRDLLGRLNQAAAGGADEAYLVVAGLAVELKRLATRPEECVL